MSVQQGSAEVVVVKYPWTSETDPVNHFEGFCFVLANRSCPLVTSTLLLLLLLAHLDLLKYCRAYEMAIDFLYQY